MKKRILSCVLSAALLLGLTPWSALATDDPLTDQTKVQTDFQSPPQNPDIYSDPQPNITVPENTLQAAALPMPVAAAAPITDEAGLKNAITDGATIQLDKDITTTSTITIPEGASVTLDLKGYTLTADFSPKTNGSLLEGSAIQVESGATLTLQDSVGNGKITHTDGQIGRGVYVNGGTFNMDGGSVSKNCIGGSFGGGGAGVYIDNGTFTMTGGSIAENKIKDNLGGSGGGVYVANGEFNMSGGSITGNTITAVVVNDKTYGGGYGGGVYVATNATFNMSGGTISGNQVNYDGGGVCLYGTFTMTGGTIENNKSSKGGGVYVHGDATFTMTDGKITGNEATSGGGVYFYWYENANHENANKGKFIVSGTPTITGNTSYNKGNVCLAEKATLTIGEGGLKSGAKIGVGILSNRQPASGAYVTIATGVDNGYVTGSVFADDSNNYKIRKSGTELVLLGKNGHVDHDDQTFEKALTSGTKDELLIDKTAATSVSDGYLLKAGSYYLKSDLTLGRPIAIASDVKLCLNGHKITVNSNSSVIILEAGANFSLYDCGGTGIITHSSGKYGYGVYAFSKGSGMTFDMYGGTISGNNGNSTYKGGGVYLNHFDAVFNLHDGTISGNTTSASGGGVSVVNGIFNMYNGTISKNTATGSGGGVFVDSGTFNMSGGTIDGNTTTENNGGGVFVNGYGTFNLHDGTISNNKSTASKNSSYEYGGGGVYAIGKLNLSGGTITGNTATADGNGVFVKRSASVTLSGNVQIKDNTQSNLYLYGGAAFKIGTAGLGDKASIGVKVDTLATGDIVKIATGAGDVDVTGKITSDDNYDVKTINGEVYLANGEVHMHPICGDHGESVKWKPIGTAAELNAIADAGNYYLTADIELVNNSTDPTSVANVTWAPVDNVVLDLCGHNITVVDNITNQNVDDIDAITVNSGVTFTLTDCKNSGQGNYGKITHNKRIDLGCGVKVVGGTFIMYGGEISGNYLGASGPSGAGVCVQKLGTFTLYDGLITKNYCPTGGSGVSLRDKGTTVNLCGGTITGNYADSYYQYSSRGSGVKVNGGTLTVSGDVQITGNKMADNGDKFIGGTESNVYLFGGNTITIDGTLTGTIGVGTEKTPYGSSRIKIATNATADSLKHFTIDKKDADYMLVLDGNALYLSAHQHGDWTYDVSGNTITVKCGSTLGTCGLADRIAGTYTITAPSSADLIYNGSAKAATVTATPKSGVTLPATPDIQYQKEEGDTLKSAPTDAGTYIASITVGGVKAQVEYTVLPKMIDAFTYSSDPLTYNGTEQTCPELNVKLNEGGSKVALQAGTDYIISGDNKGTNAGTYTLQLTFCGNYKCDHPELGKIEWKIVPLTVELDWQNVTDRTYGDSKTVTATVSNKYGNDDVSVTVEDGGKTAVGTYTAKATGLTGAQADNYKLAGNQTQEYTIGKKSIAIPAENTTKFTYNGAEQTYMTGSADYTVSGNVQKDAGTYTVTAALRDKVNTQWANGKTDDRTYSFKIDPKPVTVTAKDQVTRIGQPLATLTYTCDPAPYTGDAFTGELATNANKDQLSDQYTISQGDLSLGNNYTITFVPGKYTVTNKLLQDFKFTDSKLSKTYGDEPFTVTATGAAEGSTVSYTSDKTSVATVDSDGHVTIVGAGHATITATAAETKDYVSANAAYTLTVARAELTITAKDQSAYIGDKVPELGADSYTVTGLVKGESLTTALTILPTVRYVDENGQQVKPDMTKAGETAIRASGAVASDNYSITYADGKLTVSTRPSSGGGGGSSTPSYPVSTPSKGGNGSVSSNAKNAASGSTVTITVKPDSGYQLETLTVTDRKGNALKLTDQGNGTYTFTMPSGQVDVKATFTQAADETSPFDDVSKDDYYYDAVKWAADSGITGGVGGSLFGSDQSCTRAQIITFLWRAAGSPEPKGAANMTDVPQDAYYAKAVAWAMENGIASGTGADRFSPHASCTRAQGMTFLFRSSKASASGTPAFQDVAADAYYAQAVKWAADSGITSGIGGGLFGPDSGCTRAQIVTFLWRLYAGK